MAKASRRGESDDDAAVGEPEAIEGAPSPREQTHLFGHQAAEHELLEAYRSGRLHHGWILGGPRGIGKATLAMRFARFVLAHPDPASPAVQAVTGLGVAADAPAARLMGAGAHPDLLHLRRPWDDKAKRFKTEITVDEVRRLVPFFGSTAGTGGYRIVVIDAADDLNANAANAVLKMLEEPPRKGLFLLVSHAPGRLLPTIRSRTRRLMLRPLAAADVAEGLLALGLTADRSVAARAAAISEGSLRRAATALAGGAVDVEGALAPLLARLSAEPDRRAVYLFAELVSGREAAEAYDLSIDLIRAFISDRVRSSAAAGAHPRTLSAWAEAWEKIDRAVARADAFNLDRKQVVIGVFQDLSDAARLAAA